MRRLILLLGMLLTALCLAPAWAQEWRIHTVSRGENLTTIARRYDITVNELREWNDLRGDRILVGQRLRIPSADQEWYVVRRGDNLSTIAQRHDITVALLRRLNDLNGSRIHPGQRLRLRPSPMDEAVHVVRRGDNLSTIAQRHGMTLQRLKRINGLESDRIYPGQTLHLREAGTSVHLVRRGDALWEIARAYGTTVAELKRINGLTSDRIHPGQELTVTAGEDAAPVLASYTVRRGDNLTEIADLHQMTLRELRDLNGIRGSLIHPGQELKVRPMLGAPAAAPTGATASWASLMEAVPGVTFVDADNGPYHHFAPRAERQRSATYAEDARLKPKTAYARARALWEHFLQDVDRLGRRSDRLAGWHVVLDPGHGGVDPGCIMKGRDQDGQDFYVVEDEYCYDLSLRVAALLRMHGADVTMTVLSPNHLIRSNSPAINTFVHDRTEVFNSASWHSSNTARTWPRGNASHLDERVAISRRAFKGVPASRQIFLSFHADNDPTAGDAVTLFYQQTSRSTDTVSRSFARKLLDAMGAGARMKGRNLHVLRNNPARHKLLVEMRNLAYEEHVWAIRYEPLRQRDAEKVVRALLDGLTPTGAGGARTAGP